MKKTAVVFLVVFFQLATVCRISYNELGERTYLYYLDGQPVYPVCTTENYPYARSMGGGGLAVHLCNEDVRMNLDYRIAAYQGPGKYAYGAPKNKVEIIYTEGLHVFDSVHPGSYIYILEWDAQKGFISAVFEAHVSDSLGHERHITSGRINLFAKPDIPDND